MRPPSLISVIIVTYNNERQISRCIESVLQAEEKEIEIILVDNASTDRTRSEVSRYLSGRNVRLVQNLTNLGFPSGVNIGVANSNGTLILLLNPDAYLEPAALDLLLRRFEDHPDLLIVQPKILRASDPTKIDSTGDFVDSYGFGIRRGADPPEEDRRQYDNSTSIFSARGAALMTTRALFDFVGGMDGSFFALYEDIDFCWRARLKGAGVVFVPEARVLHDASTSLTSELRAFHGTKNRLTMLVKNYEAHNLLFRLPPALVMALWLSLGELMVGHSLRLAMLRLRGIFWVVLRLPWIWKERIRIQRTRRLSDDKIASLNAKR